jgi:hypothetical protein
MIMRICSGFFRITRRTTNVKPLWLDEEYNAVMREYSIFTKHQNENAISQRVTLCGGEATER